MEDKRQSTEPLGESGSGAAAPGTFEERLKELGYVPIARASQEKPRTAEEVLGSLIKRIRESRGISQQGLASVMTSYGFSWRQTTVAKTEAGQRPIRVNEVVGIARVFGIQPGSLINPAGEESEDHERFLWAQSALSRAMNRLDSLRKEVVEAENRVIELIGICREAEEFYLDSILENSEGEMGAFDDRYEAIRQTVLKLKNEAGGS